MRSFQWSTHNATNASTWTEISWPEQEHPPHEPPLGHLQFLVLHKLEELEEAHGYNVLEQLCMESGVWIDTAAIYGTIRKLFDRELITEAGTRKQRGAPPFKMYKVTAAGRAALKATIEHYQAIVGYVNDKRKATRG